MDDWDVPYRQSVYEVLALLRGDWTVAVLATLALGELEFTKLRNEVNEAEERSGWTAHSKPLTARTLTDTLRRLEQDGLVERRAEGSAFSNVWYKLSPDGRALLRALRPLATWSQQRRDQTRAESRGHR